MGEVTCFGEVGPHHPIYGIHRQNVASRLTSRNWGSKALWRQHPNAGLYIYVERGTAEDEKGPEQVEYYVRVRAMTRGDVPDYQRTFTSLREALGYANGQGDSVIGRETRPAPLESLPENASELLTAFPRTDGGKS